MDPRHELLRYFRWLRRSGLNDARGGSASVRVGAWLWLTRGDLAAEAMTVDALVRLPLYPDAAVASETPPDNLPSALHLAVQRRQTASGVLLGCRPPALLALVRAGVADMPLVDGSPLRTLTGAEPALVAETLLGTPAVVVAGQQLYCWGEHADQAYALASALAQEASILLGMYCLPGVRH